MARRAGFQGRLMDFSHAVHLMIKKVPGAMEGDGDPVAIQLDVSAMMVGPKYGGIVRGLDRGHVLDRLELCCGNAREATYWLEFVQGYWPDLAEEAKWLGREAVDLVELLDRRMAVFAQGLHELDGEEMPWAPFNFEDDDEDDELDFSNWDDDDDDGEEPG